MRRPIIFGLSAVILVCLITLTVISARQISSEDAQLFAEHEFSSITIQLDIDQSELVGPTTIRESVNGYYFSWARLENPNQDVITVWVSKFGETDATILDDSLLDKYRERY